MRVKRLTKSAVLPTKAHRDEDLGYDLYSDEPVVLFSNTTKKISTGIIIEFPKGFGGIIKDRSSLASCMLTTSGGVIDSGYRGEIFVLLTNNSFGTLYITKGQKIAQLILIPIVHSDIEETTEPLSETVRGEKGFGSSGV
jgi:dUTP pyrophosphatase